MQSKMEKHYGLSHMTFDEELNSPVSIVSTRRSKIEIIDDCEKLIKMATDMIEYAKRIPEEKNVRHATLTKELAKKVRGTRNSTEDWYSHIQ